ncbi:hypothetical protein L3Q82_011200, partial [Scortum barcoo]
TAMVHLNAALTFSKQGCRRKECLTMKNGADFCVDPSVAWVQTIIKTLHANQGLKTERP